jgi:hypothetical protein
MKPGEKLQLILTALKEVNILILKQIMIRSEHLQYLLSNIEKMFRKFGHEKECSGRL